MKKPRKIKKQGLFQLLIPTVLLLSLSTCLYGNISLLQKNSTSKQISQINTNSSSSNFFLQLNNNLLFPQNLADIENELEEEEDDDIDENFYSTISRTFVVDFQNQIFLKKFSNNRFKCQSAPLYLLFKSWKINLI